MMSLKPALVWKVWYGTIVRMPRLAPAHRRLTAREVVRIHVGEHRDLNVEQRHVDMMAFAVRSRCVGAVSTAMVEYMPVRSAIATPAFCGPPLTTVALAGNAHESAVHDEVVARALRTHPGPVCPETRHRTVRLRSGFTSF